MTGFGMKCVRWNIGLSVLGVLGLGAGQAQAGTLSGKVLQLDSTGQAGVTVALVGSQSLSTQTAADGSWSLSPITTGIRYAVPTSVSTKGRMQLENSHVKLGFQGADIAGRNPSRLSTVFAPAAVVARAASAPDTLVYTWNSKEILRDTVTNLDQSGILRSFDTTINAAVTYGYLTDSRDSHWYRTVLIGKQLWMAQNLNYKVDSSWGLGAGLDTLARLGRLYNWMAAASVKDSCKTVYCLTSTRPPYQGICPTGWHLPQEAEYDTLVANAEIKGGSGKAGAALKATTGWGASASASTDLFGFMALPTGNRSQYGAYDNTETATYFLTSTETTNLKYAYRYLGYASNSVTANGFSKAIAAPVRCVRN